MLGRTPVTEYPKGRLNTLRYAKRPMPRDVGDELEASDIPAKASAQATASEALQEEREARETNSAGTLSTRSPDEQDHATQDNPIQAAAAWTETDADCSGGMGSMG